MIACGASRGPRMVSTGSSAVCGLLLAASLLACMQSLPVCMADCFPSALVHWLLLLKLVRAQAARWQAAAATKPSGYGAARMRTLLHSQQC